MSEETPLCIIASSSLHAYMDRLSLKKKRKEQNKNYLKRCSGRWKSEPDHDFILLNSQVVNGFYTLRKKGAKRGFRCPVYGTLAPERVQEPFGEPFKGSIVCSGTRAQI